MLQSGPAGPPQRAKTVPQRPPLLPACRRRTCAPWDGCIHQALHAGAQFTYSGLCAAVPAVRRTGRESRRGAGRAEEGVDHPPALSAACLMGPFIPLTLTGFNLPSTFLPLPLLMHLWVILGPNLHGWISPGIHTLYAANTAGRARSRRSGRGAVLVGERGGTPSKEEEREGGGPSGARQLQESPGEPDSRALTVELWQQVDSTCVQLIAIQAGTQFWHRQPVEQAGLPAGQPSASASTSVPLLLAPGPAASAAAPNMG